jgi:hypothetical protein
VKKSATHTPASSSSAAIPTVPMPLPMIAACVLAPTSARAAMSTGRRSGIRSATTLPSTPPIPKQATIAAQLEAPSSSRSESAGPSTNTAGRTNT